MNGVRSYLATCVVVISALVLPGCRPQQEPPAPPASEGATGAGTPPAESEGRALIAVLLDLTGPQSSLGKPAMNGFTLAMEEAAHSATHVAFAHVDTKTDDGVTKTAAEETAQKATCGAGFTNNESLLIAGPAYQQAGKPFLSIGATDPALPDVVGDQIFLAGFGDNAQAAAAAEFAHAEFGGTTVILWDSTTPYTRMLPKYFRTRFAQLGGTVLLDRSFEGCDLGDAGRMIAELPDEPAFVYLAAMPDCAGEQVASLRAAGVALPIIGGDGLDTPHLLSTRHGPTDDVWFTTHAWLSAETGTARAKAFVHAYENAYGHPPGDAFAALGYDSALLLLDAVGRAQGTSPAEVHAALEGTRDFEGVTGTISYGPHRHVPSKTVWIIHVEDGQQSLAAALVPKSVPPPVVAE